MNIFSRSSECIISQNPGELLAYHESLDIFFDLLSSINNKVRDSDPLRIIRTRVKTLSKRVYLVNNKELRIDYYRKLGEYRSLLFSFYKYTGMVPPRSTDLFSGEGDISKVNKEDLLKPDVLDIDQYIDKKGLKLSESELKQINKYVEDDDNDIDIDNFDDDLDVGL